MNNVNIKVLTELEKILSVKDATFKKSNGLLQNKTFIFPGKLQGISRAEGKSLIEENSGSIVSNVSKKLDYLISGEKPTKRKVDWQNNLILKC